MRSLPLRAISLLSLLYAGATFAAAPHTATLAVENMTCGTCPIVVKKALERVPGARDGGPYGTVRRLFI
jgi:periplasmic mercuric ion binding protein